MFRFFLVFTIFFVLTHGASAQTPNDLQVQLQQALKQGDADVALKTANTLYQLSDSNDDHKFASFAAYAKASVLEQQKEYIEAAQAYGDCSHHYAKINSAAQSIQCEYKSSLAFLAGYKSGQALEALKSAAKRLEDIGQEKSGIASQVYLTLAEETLPAKFEDNRSARVKRKAAAEYAQKSLISLEATGQANSEDYVSALFLKGLALEDSQEFEEAVQTYAAAVKLYSSMSDRSDEVLNNVKTRLSIAKSELKGGKNSKLIDVTDINGRKVSLVFSKKKNVKFPRVNKNQMVDGARASVEISLAEDGSVNSVKVLETTPSKEFGEALEKAAKKWVFVTSDGETPKDILPFTYNMVFWVKRI